MTKEIYQALEKRLTDEVPELKIVDWFANQYDTDEEDNDRVWITPAVFLEFLPVVWLNTGDSLIQETLLTFRVHTVTDNNFADSKRFTATDHLEIQKKVHKALQDFCCALSYIEPNIPANTDHILINEITRKGSESDHALNVFIATKQEYHAQIFDLSLYLDSVQQAQTATIDITLDVVKVPKFTEN